MNGKRGLGGRAPMAFSLGRSSDLWSEFFTCYAATSSMKISFARRFSNGRCCEEGMDIPGRTGPASESCEQHHIFMMSMAANDTATVAEIP